MYAWRHQCCLAEGRKPAPGPRKKHKEEENSSDHNSKVWSQLAFLRVSLRPSATLLVKPVSLSACLNSKTPPSLDTFPPLNSASTLRCLHPGNWIASVVQFVTVSRSSPGALHMLNEHALAGFVPEPVAAVGDFALMANLCRWPHTARWGILRWPQVGDFGWPSGHSIVPQPTLRPRRFFFFFTGNRPIGFIRLSHYMSQGTQIFLSRSSSPKISRTEPRLMILPL